MGVAFNELRRFDKKVRNVLTRPGRRYHLAAGCGSGLQPAKHSELTTNLDGS